MYKKNFIEQAFFKIYFLFTSFYFRIVHKIKIGKKCKIYFSSTIRGSIVIGEEVSIGKFSNITGNIEIGNLSYIGEFTRLNTMQNGKIIIGNNCHINVFNLIGSSKKVTIGDNALFAAGIKITDATHNIDDVNVLTKVSIVDTEEVSIGKNCWLGFDVNVIMGGQIGQNCVIGSKSLVNKKIPSNVIAVGVPAKIIKKRLYIEK